MRWTTASIAGWALTVLAPVLGIGLGAASSACTVHASVEAQPYAPEPPPPPRQERAAPREGEVWIRGHWEWRGERGWVWKRGRSIAARSGHEWEEGRWVKRDNRYHWVEGRWVAAGEVHVREHRETRDHRSSGVPPEPAPAGGVETRDHRTQAPPAQPTEPPPAPRAESPSPRPGYVWIAGRYEWRNGNYTWKRGRWERARSGKTWQPGRWERQGRVYVWVRGRWVDGADVKVRDHRKR